MASRRTIAWAGVAIACAALFFVAGFVVQDLLDDGDGDSEGVTAASTPTPIASRPASPTTTSAAASATAPPPTTAATSPAPATAPQPAPTPTLTPIPRPAVVTVRSVNPPLGTHIEVDTIEIALDVSYEAGNDSNVLGWSLMYCAASNDCNTYGYGHSREIVPGSTGDVTIGAPFPAGGNYLRPIVVCQYTVEIARYLTTEARWQSGLSEDPRCHPEVTAPRVKVLGVTPELGTIVQAGDVISVNLEYDAGPATRAEARYSVEDCAGDLFAFRSTDITPGSSGIVTILIPVSAETTGPLRHIDAALMQGDARIATYGFGPC